MAEQWSGEIVAKLHLHGITRRELADEMGVTAQYVTMVLNGKKSPAKMEERMDGAINAILSRRTA